MDETVCSFEGCDFRCPSDGNAIAKMIAHALATHVEMPAPLAPPIPPPAVHVQAPSARQPRLDRPIIDINCSPSDWQQFCRKFERFRIGSEIPTASATAQLLHCLSDRLYSTTTRSTPTLEQMSVTNALAAIKTVAVLPVALGVRQAKALDTKQSEGQRFRMFVDQIRERVVDCAFSTPCTHAIAPDIKCNAVANCNGDLSHIFKKFEFNLLRRGTFVVIIKMKFGTEMKRLASSQSLLGFTWVSMGLLAIMKKSPLISM